MNLWGLWLFAEIKIMLSTSIVLSIEDSIAEICLIPPGRKPPTLDAVSLGEFEVILKQIHEEASRIQMVVVTTTSEKFFCVGANVDALKDMNEKTIGPWVARGHELFNQLEDLPMPTIAKVNGYALGGGLELAMACDFIFATPIAQLGLTEAKLGFVSGWGGSFRLVERIGHSLAKRCFFTAKMLDAATALKVGLVDFVGSGEEIDREIEMLARESSSCSRFAIKSFKKILNEERLAARQRNLEAEKTYSIQSLQEPETLKQLEQFFKPKTEQ